MRRISMAIPMLVVIALLASGCTDHFKSNGWIYEDTDGDGIIDRGYREHSFVKPEETNGAYIDHLNWDEKILDADGNIVAINHKNEQYVVNPPDPELEGLSAVGYEFSVEGKKKPHKDQSVLWIAIASITVDGSGDAEIVLDMNGNQARTVYENLRNIVAVGAKYGDDTELWADAEILE